MKTLAAECGEPVGRARMGWETDRGATSSSVMSAADKARASKSIRDSTQNLGFVVGERDAPASGSVRNKLNEAQLEQRARLGIHSARTYCPDSERARLRAQQDGGLARLGMVSERDSMPETERRRLRDKIADERTRKAWEPMERDRLTPRAKTAWDDRCAKSRGLAGMVSPYLEQHYVSEHERTRE